MLHVSDNLVEAERAKYQDIWTFPEYARHTASLDHVDHFMRIIQPPSLSTLIDLGCGSGAAGLEFKRRGLVVHWLDLTDAALADEVPRDRFIEQPLWSNWPNGKKVGWDYAFCIDVLEHLPTEYVMLVLDKIINSCRTSYLLISCMPDNFGQLIGKPLHLTVRPFEWWLERIASLGEVVDARDLTADGLFVVRK